MKVAAADALAEELIDAADRREPILPVAERTSRFSLKAAYAVQEAVTARRLAAGDRVVGAKVGLALSAERQALAADEPCYGVLLASMLVPAEEPIRMAELIHPGVQPAIVFRLRETLAGPGVTAGDVLAATDCLACALEVVDSRYTGPSARLEDIVADSASAARVVLGSRWVPPSEIPDLSLVGCSVEADGVPVTTAAGAAVLGHPAAAVARLANWIGGSGGAVEKDWIVLSGGLTPAVPLVPGGHVTATFGRLGRITVRALPVT